MDINDVKTQLLSKLQNSYLGILGGGIRKQNDEPYIVVYIGSPEKEQHVPINFKGFTVKTEVKKIAKAY